MLVSRSLHPMKVQVIEAMHWIGRPLASSDLCRVFEDTYELALIDYHVKKLAKLGALRRDGTEKVRGAMKYYYVLVELSDW